MDIERVRGVISQMKLPEKLALIGGGTTTAAIGRLNVPGMSMGDVLMPYSAEEPSLLALGCTFSPTLCAAVAKYRSAEAVGQGLAFSGTVGCGIMTDPMRPDACGLFSEDAYLTAELLSAYSSAGEIGFVFTDALGQGRYNNRTVDGRALYELYLYPLIKAGKNAAAVMLDGGYLNGAAVAASRTVADIYAKYVPQTAMFITPCDFGDGLDTVIGNGAYRLCEDESYKKAVGKAVVDGTLFENKLNIGLERTVATAALTHEFYKNHENVSVEPTNIVIDSTVLLKNDGVLPTAAKNITVFGDPDAFDDGAAYRMFAPKDAAKKYGAFNLFLVTDYGANGIDPVFASAICAAGTAAPTVVVLCGECAAPLPIEYYANAILFCPYVTTVSAVIAMLTTTSPRGHLPFTWLKNRSAYPRNNEKYNSRGDFRYESVYNGYRLFNNFKSDIAFPFGHGLDYTRYEISQYAVTCNKLKITAEFVIKNAGSRAGSALCQIYVTPPSDAVYGTGKRLCAFRRVALEATENARVKMEIDLGEFGVYDEANGAMLPIGGKYKVELGLSSLDIRAAADIKVPAGSRVTAGLPENLAPSYYKAGKGETFEPTAPEIERLLKVPFIKKPDEYTDILPPAPSKIKKLLKRAEKTTDKRLFPIVRYKIENTPINDK